MSYKDSLKKSQGGGGGNFIKLPITKIYKLKDEGNTLKFATYNKESKEDEFVEKLSGVLIGQAMTVGVFEASFGKKGGSWNSSHYFTKKDTVVLWSPSNQIDFKGSAEDAADFLFKTVRANPKKRMSLFVATDTGLIEVQTNVTLAIDLGKRIKKDLGEDVFLDNVILLTPAIYKAEDFGKDVHKIMKESIVSKNPPKYAMIEVGSEISNTLAQELDLESLANQFSEWKAQISKGDTKVIENSGSTVNEQEPQKPEITDDLPF